MFHHFTHRHHLAEDFLQGLRWTALQRVDTEPMLGDGDFGADDGCGQGECHAARAGMSSRDKGKFIQDENILK